MWGELSLPVIYWGLCIWGVVMGKSLVTCNTYCLTSVLPQFQILWCDCSHAKPDIDGFSSDQWTWREGAEQEVSVAGYLICDHDCTISRLPLWHVLVITSVCGTLRLLGLIGSGDGWLAVRSFSTALLCLLEWFCWAWCIIADPLWWISSWYTWSTRHIMKQRQQKHNVHLFLSPQALQATFLADPVFLDPLSSLILLCQFIHLITWLQQSALCSWLLA